MINKMKRVNSFLIAAFVAASALMVASCDSDDDEADNPQVNVKITGGKSTVTIDTSTGDTGAGEVAGDQGTMLVFDVVYTMGANRLKEVKLESKVGSRSAFIVLDSVLNDGVFSVGQKEVKFRYDTNIGLEEEVLTLTAIDKKERKKTLNITIKTTLPDAITPPADDDFEFIKYGVTELGAQKNPNLGSFYNVEMGKTYLLKAGKEASRDVDFGCFFNTGNSASIGSTKYLKANVKYSSTDNDVSKWGTANDTRFVQVSGTPAVATHDNIKSIWDENFEALPATAFKGDVTTVEYANNLVKDNVVAFKTVGNKVGLIVITAAPANDAGSLKFYIIEKKAK